MINAEELGISSKNIDEALKSKKPDVMRLVGTEGAYGEELGLTKDWAARIIRHVGNYGEVYERNVGSGSKLGIPRGLNQLWSAGGIQYAPPIRGANYKRRHSGMRPLAQARNRFARLWLFVPGPRARRKIYARINFSARLAPRNDDKSITLHPCELVGME